MRVRSTGLGKTELIQEFSKVYHKQDYLLIEMRTTEPVKWHVRTAVTYNDLLKLIKVAVRPGTIWWVLTGWRRRGNPRPIEDY